jgi:hypothetical protein
MGKRRRDALGKRRLEGAPTDKNKIRDRRKEKGVATMLTAGRRCSRRRLGVGGGAASVFTAASAPVRLLRGHERRLPRPAPRVPVKPQQRRAGGGAAHRLSPPLLLFLYSPLPLPYRRRGTGKGAKPQCGLVGDGRLRSRGDVDVRSRRRKGTDAPGAPGLAAGTDPATWPALSGRHHARGVTGRGTGVLSPC